MPEGGYHDVKVRLAQRPLAERNSSSEPDDPGLEETVWVERLSPCHGIVRSGLYEDLGVDYGDVVLFDGAPITHHEYEGERVAVFPHLVTLKRPGYRPFKTNHPRSRCASGRSRCAPATLLVSEVEPFELRIRNPPGVALRDFEDTRGARRLARQDRGYRSTR